MAPDELDPDTHYVLTNAAGGKFDRVPNVTRHEWADEQAGFLAGVAAASTTETGTVAFLGAIQTARQEEYRAGFEAGVHSIDPDIKVLAIYLAASGYSDAPDDAPDGARYLASLLYDAGADVIFHAAGRSGVGVFEAAAGLSATNRWAIGIETDQWQAAGTRERAHVLTSIIKRFDAQIYTTIQEYLDGSLAPGVRRLTVADGMITYAPSGDALNAAARANLDRTMEQLAAGRLRPPRTPIGALLERESLLDPGTGTGSFAGSDDVPVTFTLPEGWTNNGWGVIKGDPIYGLIFMNVDNIYTDSCPSAPLDPPVGPTVDDLAAAWANLPGFHATEPIDVTVDGFAGKQVEFTVPDYDEADCTYGMFRLLREAGGGGNYWAQAPNQHHELRILDVDGTRLVIGAGYFPDTSPQDRAELDEILNSIQIG